MMLLRSSSTRSLARRSDGVLWDGMNVDLQTLKDGWLSSYSAIKYIFRTIRIIALISILPVDKGPKNS